MPLAPPETPTGRPSLHCQPSPVPVPPNVQSPHKVLEASAGPTSPQGSHSVSAVLQLLRTNIATHAARLDALIPQETFALSPPRRRPVPQESLAHESPLEARPVPRQIAPEVSESFVSRLRGTIPSPSLETRRASWAVTLGWDLVIVFPNPDFEEKKECRCDDLFELDHQTVESGLHNCLHQCRPDRSTDTRGIVKSTAQQLYHETLVRVGFQEQSMKSKYDSDEVAFLEVFDSLKPLGADGCCPCAPGYKHRRRVTAGKRKDRDRPLFAGAPEVEGALPCAADFLTLVRNTVLAKLSRLGLTVELVISEDSRNVLALVGVAEPVLEGMAAQQRYPMELDVEKIDPESLEPCDRSFRPLSEEFIGVNDHEVVNLLQAVNVSKTAPDEEQSLEHPAAVQSPSLARIPSAIRPGTQDLQASSQLKGVSKRLRLAYLWYLRARLAGGGAAKSAKDANLACLHGEGEKLRCVWEELGLPGPLEVIRHPCDEAPSSVSRPLAWHVSCTVNVLGQKVYTRFPKRDRILLMMNAVEKEMDLFGLASWGYVTDVLPCPQALGMGAPEDITSKDESLGLPVVLFFEFGLHFAKWSIVPAAFGAAARALVAVFPDHTGDVLLAYTLLLNIWLSACLGAWPAKRKRLLLQRGVLPDPPVPVSGRKNALCGGTSVNVLDVGGTSARAPARRLFRGVLKYSAVTGGHEPAPYSQCLQRTRRLLSLLVCLVLAAAAFGLAAVICNLVPLFIPTLEASDIEYNFADNMVGLACAGQIVVLNPVFRRLSLVLTKFENHRSHSGYASAFVLKTLGLQLVNSYSAMFYLAYVEGPTLGYSPIYDGTTPLCEDRPGWAWWSTWGGTCLMTRLNRQLEGLLVGLLVKAVFVDVLFPLLAAWTMLFGHHKHASPSQTKSSSDCDKEAKEGRALLDLGLIRAIRNAMCSPRWADDPELTRSAAHCRFESFVIAFGFVALFLPACPAAGILACLLLACEVWSARCLLRQLLRVPLPWEAGLICEAERVAIVGMRALALVAPAMGASLLVWPAQLAGRGLVLLVLTSDWSGSDVVPWAVYCLVLLVAAFLSRTVTSWPRLHTRSLEARVLRVIEKAYSCRPPREKFPRPRRGLNTVSLIPQPAASWVHLCEEVRGGQ